MTNAEAQAIAEAVVDSLKATSAVTSARALDRARSLALEHTEKNRSQPTAKAPLPCPAAVRVTGETRKCQEDKDHTGKHRNGVVRWPA